MIVVTAGLNARTNLWTPRLSDCCCNAKTARLNVLFSQSGQVVNSSIDGCIQMKSYLSGEAPRSAALIIRLLKKILNSCTCGQECCVLPIEHVVGFVRSNCILFVRVCVLGSVLSLFGLKPKSQVGESTIFITCTCPYPRGKVILVLAWPPPILTHPYSMFSPPLFFAKWGNAGATGGQKMEMYLAKKDSACF